MQKWRWNRTTTGSTPSALQDRVEEAFAAKALRQRMPDGRERTVLLQPGDVTTAIVEYRPIYVSGDVLNPGQYAYRPQMTARHAIALSGGPSTVRGRPGSSGVARRTGRGARTRRSVPPRSRAPPRLPPLTSDRLPPLTSDRLPPLPSDRLPPLPSDHLPPLPSDHLAPRPARGSAGSSGRA